MEFEKNTILFGANSTPGIVAIALGESGTVNVYRQEKDGSTVADVEPFHPFVWCDSDVVDLGIETEKLAGDLKYGWSIAVDSWKELVALRNGLKNISGVKVWTSNDPALSAGLTLFSVRDIPMANVQKAIMSRDRIYIRTMGTGNLNGCRAATHIYNMPEDVDRLIASVRYVSENASRYMSTAG